MLFQFNLWAQHNNNIKINLNTETKELLIYQELTYQNTTNDSIKFIILNDWNNAFSSKKSDLAKRFSDEFSRSFHLAKEEDRGFTKINSFLDSNSETLDYEYYNDQIDLIKLHLNKPILPFSSQKIILNYVVKIPNERFTKYGFNDSGKFYLKDFILSVPRTEHKKFIKLNNENLDDISNALSDYYIEIEIPSNYTLFSDLNQTELIKNSLTNTYKINTLSKQNVTLVIESKKEIKFKSYKSQNTEVLSNFEDKNLSDIQMALVIDKITNYVSNKIGHPKGKKIIVSNEDYEKNPFYGINQFPSFINPFPDEFIFEIKFLKTYLNNLLYENLQVNHRKDHWIEEGIQHYILMNYIDDNYPNFKMLGSLSNIKMLKGYTILNTNFNQQFYYLYLLMTRKNLDQPIGDAKNTLIKFNEQIAGKYKAGLNLRYLNAYLENNIVDKSIVEYIELNKKSKTSRSDFKYILKQNSNKNIDWFFDTVVETRALIDYKFGTIKKQKDSIAITIKNRTHTNVPIPLYGFNNENIVFKKWLTNIKTDTTIVIAKKNIEKLVLNYKIEVPESNLNNNRHSLKGFVFNHRPLKFSFLKDIESPKYNQIFYMPSIEYNLYDGVKLGVKFDNKSIINKPFQFSISPEYSTNTQKIVGSVDGYLNHNIRTGKLYNIRYGLLASSSHYAPDAMYTKLIPSILFQLRDSNFRYNKKEFISLSQYYVKREKSDFIQDINTDNYSVFNLKYYNIQSEITKYYSFHTDIQIANSFGKISAEVQYRKLFENNRRINLRFYCGKFMYRNTNSDFFSFGIDRPTDYLFNYNLLGRSESTGIYSQQYVQKEGGFKSKFDTRFVNQWISTINGSFNIWNWVEIYGDAGLYKNEFIKPKFIYDSGIRLNLVPDYFELYFPIQSSNGYELKKENYDQKIRFVITLSPKTLLSLFTRKWF